jgi:hypothetical protein
MSFSSPGQIPNENSGNAVRNRITSTSIDSETLGRGNTPGRPAISSHAAPRAGIGYVA